MINILFSLHLLFSGPQLTRDINELGRIFTHPGLHRLIQDVFSEPLGLYEPLHMGQSPFLLRTIPRLRAAYAVRPDKQEQIRGIGMLLNGALYQLTIAGEVPDETLVNRWFHAAAGARSRKLRQNMLAIALFQLGRHVVVMVPDAGPRTRLESFVKTLRGQERKGRGRIHLEDAAGNRRSWHPDSGTLPETTVKLVISRPESGCLQVLPWPRDIAKSDEYPHFLK